MENIISFRGDYRFLSTFWVFENPIVYEGLEFYSIANAYVAAKTIDLNLRVQIQLMSPNKAKAFGKKIFAEKLTINPLWSDEFRLDLMESLLFQKFIKNECLAKKLLATGNVELLEGNTWHDNFFGVCTCNYCPDEKMPEGGPKNHLGKLLTKVRTALAGRQ